MLLKTSGAVMVVLVACTGAPPENRHEPAAPAPIASPVPPGTIAFGHDPEGFDFMGSGAHNGNLVLLFPDGTRTRITEARGNDFSPTFSPDRIEIAFRSDRNGNHDIYVTDVEGGSVRNLTNSAAEERSPAWSPDGTRIAFARVGDEGLQIYTMDANGSNAERLTDFDSGEGAEYPAWSPDGTQIAFHAFINRPSQADSEIFVMGSDGSNLRRITNNAYGEDTYPAWSPDGTRIAFSSSEEGNVDIYSMAPDGSDKARLTTHPGTDYSASWSERGIVFTRGEEFHIQLQSELWVMTGTGRNERRLAKGGGTVTPAWAH